MRIAGFLLMLSAAGIFILGADPGATGSTNIANWELAVLVGFGGVFQGLTVAWFRQKLNSLQTKDGCIENRAKCHVEDLRPMLSADSERRIKVDLIENELKHILLSLGELKDVVAAQGSEIAHHTKVMIKIGARFGVDFNGKDD